MQGVSYGALGSTHHSLHDFAVLRAINNITIVAPADNYETAAAIKLAAAAGKPVYLRFGKKQCPTSRRKATSRSGSGRVGSFAMAMMLLFIATGETVYPALQAARKLERKIIFMQQ